MNHFHKYATYTFSLLLSLVAASCHKDEPAPTPSLPKTTETAILLYAVASNDLAPNFYDDLQEMEIGLEKVDLSKVDYYVYSVTAALDGAPSLKMAVRNPQTGSVEFEEVKSYDRSTSSASPERISEVISDFSDLTDSSTKGLILWSHSSAWAPAPATKSRNFAPSASSTDFITTSDGYTLGKIQPTEMKWWGVDIDYDANTRTYCNLPDLASAIPDRYFNFIWFDCCYMSSIEVIYEMRNKAEMFVAYPTEVLAEGAPYNIVIPFIATSKPNLIAAADAMSDYYLTGNKIFTMAVIDVSPIEEIADLAAKAIPGERLPAHKLQKYSRSGYYFYDFGQYTSSWGATLGEDWDAEEFNRLMDRMIVYKNCGDRLFSGATLNKTNYSGISCGYFSYNPDDPKADKEVDADDQKYYLELEWFKRVYEPYWPAMNQK
ncbi:MAG: hypothetical protein K2M56_09355 [Muribaculaceae bacterium]|nr:hypothetical protein [Muribaculaceae bacterium]